MASNSPACCREMSSVENSLWRHQLLLDTGMAMAHSMLATWCLSCSRDTRSLDFSKPDVAMVNQKMVLLTTKHAVITLCTKHTVDCG